MKVLVACEFSGVVREAFRALGHEAWSCDLLPTEIPGPHLEGNVLEFLGPCQANNYKYWDILIGFPPCTYISYAGTSSWNNPGRVFKRIEALKFFADLWEAPIGRICLENPKGCASPVIAKYSQEIQPYYFGDNQLKTTWLWLKNLPLLKHSKNKTLFEDASHSQRPEPASIDNTARAKKRYYVDSLTRDPKERARFWPGIAKAMAEQWG